VHDLVVLDGASAVGAVFEFYDDGGDGGGPDGAAAAGAEVVEGKHCGWFGVFHVECCVAGKNAANGERFYLVASRLWDGCDSEAVPW
jgi:hypothetical protein